MLKKIFLIAIILLSIFSLQPAVAQNETVALNLSNSSGFLNTAGEEAGYDPAQQDIDPVIARIIKIWLNGFGFVFLFFIIYGGAIWMGAGGNEDELAKAKKIIINSSIGLAIVMFAYIITIFIVYQLSDITGFQQ